MSKIARIYQGINEIQKYYQGGVLQRLFFDWKHYIGNELNIEYAKECAGRNVVISGKTIQDSNDLSNIESVGEKEDNLVTIRNYNYQCETDGVILPNGIKNTIDIIDGKKVHVQRVMKGRILAQVFQGSGNTATSFEFTCSWGKVGTSAGGVLYDNEFFYYGNTKNNPRLGVSFYSSGATAWVRVSKEEFLTGKDVANYFNNNPMYVYFELKEPIYTYLESGLYDDITIPTSNVKNEIYLENGKWYHKRNIEKVVFDGSDDEGWEYSENPKRFSSRYIKNAKYKNVRTPIYADGYTFSELEGDHFDKLAFLKSFGNSIYIYNYDYTTVDDFKAYLAENPLEVYYELAEPIISDLYYDDITYKLSEPLRSLPDSVCDTIEEGKIVRRVGKYTFTNKNHFSSPFGSGNPNNGTRLFETKIIPSKTSKIICDKFNYVDWGDISNTSKIAMARFSNSGDLIFRHNSTSLQEFQNYLLENPVTVYYELATPIETEITPDMILINGEPITDTVDIELPNGERDSIYNGYYVKKVRKVVFDGSSDELWFFSGVNNIYKENHNGANLIEYRLFNPYIASKKENNFSYESIDNTLSPYYGTGANYISLPENSFMCQGKFINFGCHFDTLAEFRTFLSENPFTFWYELATPVKIPLFSIKEGLTTLKSTNNITPQIELDCLVRDGFQNMCDNEWESGDIDLNTGTIDNTNSSRIRLINYIKVKSNTKYRMDVVNSVKTLNEGYIGARYYDNEKSYLDMGGSIGTISKSSIVFTTPEDCCYIRFIAETTDVNFKIYLKEVF